MEEFVKKELRMQARDFLMLTASGSYCMSAAEERAITFDDMYFMCAQQGARVMAEITVQPPRKKLASMNIYEYDSEDPSYKSVVSAKTYEMLGELFSCTPDEAERRHADIERRVEEFRRRRPV